MATKQISLVHGSSDLHPKHAPCLAQNDCSDLEKARATGENQRNLSSWVTHSIGGAIPPIPLSHPSERTTESRRKSGTAVLRELQPMVRFPASALLRLGREDIFVNATCGTASTHKWNHGAVEQWLTSPQLKVRWPAKDAYGTANDPAPDIRSHMRAILGASIEVLGFAHA